MNVRRLVPLTLSLAAFALPATAPAQVPLTPPPGGPAGQVGLSNERTITRWAYPVATVQVRAWPSGGSRAIGPLRLHSGDGASEVYVVLASWRDGRGVEWARIRVPGRPRSRVGWVTRTALGSYGTSRNAIRINRRLLTLTGYRNGKVVLHAPVGVGKQGTPTPDGHYWIRDRFLLPPGTILGAAAMTTSATSATLTDWPGGAIVGIHGTNEPGLVPGRPSHGCVRMHDADARRLYRLATPGTPVEIV